MDLCRCPAKYVSPAESILIRTGHAHSVGRLEYQEDDPLKFFFRHIAQQCLTQHFTQRSSGHTEMRFFLHFGHLYFSFFIRPPILPIA